MDLKSIYNYQNKKCVDEMIGFIINENDIIYFQREDYKECIVFPEDTIIYFQKKNLQIKKCFVLILESPHYDEFFAEKIMRYENSSEKHNCRPANGKTGKNIRDFFAQLIKENNIIIENDKIYPVIIINAVQVQCSCGIGREILRDENFIDCFLGEKFNYLDLIRRIDNCPQDKIIFNFCTLGSKITDGKFNKNFLEKINNINISKDDQSLRQIVTNRIINKIKFESFYSGNHPSCWNKTKLSISKVS